MQISNKHVLWFEENNWGKTYSIDRLKAFDLPQTDTDTFYDLKFDDHFHEYLNELDTTSTSGLKNLDALIAWIDGVVGNIRCEYDGDTDIQELEPIGYFFNGANSVMFSFYNHAEALGDIACAIHNSIQEFRKDYKDSDYELYRIEPHFRFEMYISKKTSEKFEVQISRQRLEADK